MACSRSPPGNALSAIYPRPHCLHELDNELTSKTSYKVAILGSPTRRQYPTTLSDSSTPFVNLGIHLQCQNDQAAYKLIPILEWLKQEGYLDQTRESLLDGLRKTESKGIGPWRRTR